MISNLVDAIYWLIASWLGWKRTPEEGLALGLPPLGDGVPIEQFLPSEDVLAYVLDDDPSIYVAPGSEEEVAAHLNAQVDGDTWQFLENGVEIKKERKEVERPLAGSTVAVAKFVTWSGFRCVTLPAGTWLPLFKRERGYRGWRYKHVKSFKTNVEGKWCLISSRYAKCSVVWKECTGSYRVRRRGRPVISQETHKIGACNE